MSTKSFFTGLLTGLLMALLMALLGVFFWPKKAEPVPILAEKFSAEKHGEEIAKPIHSVKVQGPRAVFTYEVPTAHYGLLRGEVQASRAALQYKHSLGLGVVALNTSLLGRLSYGYKQMDFSLYGGYDFRHREAVFGAGLGYRFSF